MGITWIPPSPIPGVGGTVSCVSGSPNEWLSCDKGESIFGEIATIHSDQISCQVVHICTPSPPPGMTIIDTATGIIVMGLVSDILNTQINTEFTIKQDPPGKVTTSGSVPANSILTHYTPLATDRVTYTITVIATWKHKPGSSVVTTSYSMDWKVTIYNPWRVERDTVIDIVAQEN